MRKCTHGALEEQVSELEGENRLATPFFSMRMSFAVSRRFCDWLIIVWIVP